MGVSVESKLSEIQSDGHYPKSFANENPQATADTSLWEVLKAYLSEKRDDPKPRSPIPVTPMTAEQLLEEKEDVVYRLGHSSVLMKMSGQLIMADPVFSDRASPVQFMGPKRFHAPPISLSDLPDMDVVVISHDHYDHLDKASIQALVDKVDRFLVPLKIGHYLRKWGVTEEKLVEMNWWQAYEHNGVTYTLTPTQHFSGRGLSNRNQTLWGSWAIKSPEKSVFFSGDSGYFDGFKTIGERLGPFDLTMIETGAYNKLWSHIHMFPEQSVQAHIDLQGKQMMPIHNSTFDLSMHSWNEPLKEAQRISESRGVEMVSPEIGQRLVIGEQREQIRWWQF